MKSKSAAHFLLLAVIIVTTACERSFPTYPDSGSDGGIDKEADEYDSDTGSDSNSNTDADGGVADSGNNNNFSNPTLSDYRPCKSDSDCPQGLGSCIQEIQFNISERYGSTYVPIREVFNGLDSQGICTRNCAGQPSVCDELVLKGARGEEVPYTCQLVYSGTSPYPDPVPDFPFDDQIRGDEMDAGVAYGAICRPPFELDSTIPVSFCKTCGSSLECNDELCWDFLNTEQTDDGNLGVCLMGCDYEKPCPVGFICEEFEGSDSNPASLGSFCRPIQDTCGVCRDIDGDGRGVGECNKGSSVDCDDKNRFAYYDDSNMHHPFPKHCGEFDYNCNGISDMAEQVGADVFTAEHCGACDAPCEGEFFVDEMLNSTSVCRDDGESIDCVVQCMYPEESADCNNDLSDGCEIIIGEDKERLFYLDADADGRGDPNKPEFACESFEGDAPEGYASNSDDCDDTIPYKEGAICGTGAHGICDQGIYVCRWDTFEMDCVGTNQPTDEICNGLDDDCDGETDEEIVESSSRDCIVEGKSGKCALGRWRCYGSKTVCEPRYASTPEVQGDGIDSNCDGFDGILATAVFVAPGSENGDGSPSNPFNSLQDAIDKAAELGHDVYVAVGTLESSKNMLLRNGVSIYGGYRREVESAEPWPLSDVGFSVIVRSGETNKDRSVIGLDGSNLINTTTLFSIAIFVETPDEPGSGTYGLRCDNCSGLVLDNFHLNVGNATDGSKGENGPEGPNGGDADGRYGGIGGCAPGGTNELDQDGKALYEAGAPGGNSDSGEGGIGGVYYWSFGGSGISGIRQGVDGADGGKNAFDYITSQWRGDGENGATGNSGSGGGAGGSIAGSADYIGGGGGAGGCGGSGGKGGQGGGSAIGMLITSTPRIDPVYVTVTVGNGGNGGHSGNGGNGGSGGSGDYNGYSGGGKGGDGAGGGGGGGGAGGDSIGILYDDVTDIYWDHIIIEVGTGGLAGNMGLQGEAGSTGAEPGFDGSDGEKGRARETFGFGSCIVHVNQDGGDDNIGNDEIGKAWEYAVATVQKGLTLASNRIVQLGLNSCEVRVAAGTYRPTDDTNDPEASFVLAPNVALLGGFGGYEVSRFERNIGANETILSGDIADDDVPDNMSTNKADNLHSVVTGADLAGIDGFTISGSIAEDGGGLINNKASPYVIDCTFKENTVGMRNSASSPIVMNTTFTGNPTGIANYSSSPVVVDSTFDANNAEGGSGIYNEYSSPEVTGCTFSGFSSDYGGGMFNFYYSSPTVNGCTFSNNNAVLSGGGMANLDNSSPKVIDCTFNGNKAVTGAGMFNAKYADSEVTNCTFVDNEADITGGGMFNADNADTKVSTCTFHNNSAKYTGGGIDNYAASPEVINCIFYSNTAGNSGGGLSNRGYSYTSVINSTFFGNEAVNYGGGVYNFYYSSSTVTNSIVWKNTVGPSGSGPQISNIDNSSCAINYSVVLGGYSGTGNIGQNPYFVKALSGDFHIKKQSPCIDRANDAVAPVTDKDGFSRVDIPPAEIDDSYADIGAYEYQP